MGIIFISTEKKQIDNYIHFCAGEQPGLLCIFCI